MNKILLALFFSLGLGKLASIDKDWIHLKLGYYTNDKEVYNFLLSVDNFYEKLGLYNLKSFELIPSIKGMESSVLLMNFLITYTPMFFIIILIFSLIFKSKKPKPIISDLPEKIRLYLDYMLEVELQKRVQKEVHRELLRLQQLRTAKESKVV